MATAESSQGEVKTEGRQGEEQRKPALEICANSLQSALNAQKGGADRIELCQNLEAGGITPSYGLIRVVKQRIAIPVFVLIRPRPGDFIYTNDEFDIMMADLNICRELGVEGVVLGILDSDHRVDVARTSRLVEAAKPMQVTFHRAFNDCIDRQKGMEDVISTGCRRILTSGVSAGTAVDNVLEISNLQVFARRRIVVMAGGGVASADDVRKLRRAGLSELHASASRMKSAENAKYISAFNLDMKETDLETVKALTNEMQKHA